MKLEEHIDEAIRHLSIAVGKCPREKLFLWIPIYKGLVCALLKLQRLRKKVDSGRQIRKMARNNGSEF